MLTSDRLPPRVTAVKFWRVCVDEAGVAFLATATAALVLLALVPEGWQGWIVLIGFVGSVAACWRGLRLTIELDENHIVVKNYWRTYCFSWEDVREIRPGAVTIGVLPRRAIGFQLRSGQLICAQGTGGGSAVLTEALQRLRPHAARKGVAISSEFS